MKQIEIVNRLREIHSDLDKILDAASEGRVPKWLNEEGEVTEWQEYEMSGGAYNDVHEVYRAVYRLLVELELEKGSN